MQKIRDFRCSEATAHIRQFGVDTGSLGGHRVHSGQQAAKTVTLSHKTGRREAAVGGEG